jgi:hypothetical protein
MREMIGGPSGPRSEHNFRCGYPVAGELLVCALAAL